jgi:hypothetical protein
MTTPPIEDMPSGDQPVLPIEDTHTGDQPALPVVPPQVQQNLTQMETWFAALAILNTVFALVTIVFGISNLRLPFAVFSVLAGAAFIGNHGVTRRGRLGYIYSLSGSLLLLVGFPIYTIIGIFFIRRLLKAEIKAAFSNVKQV